MTLSWHWLLHAADGSEIDVPAVMAPEQRFPSQAEAETWLGENWRDLRGGSVAAVSLVEAGRRVYGPMPLRLRPGADGAADG